MKESEFQGWVTDVATRFGWRWWHVPAPMRWDSRNKKFVPAKEGRGLPDLILIHDDPPRLVFAELKGDGGKLTDAQREFLRVAQNVAAASVDDGSLEIDYTDGGDLGILGRERTVGVYAWTPEDRDTIETILRGKVMA